MGLTVGVGGILVSKISFKMLTRGQIVGKVTSSVSLKNTPEMMLSCIYDYLEIKRSLLH